MIFIKTEPVHIDDLFIRSAISFFTKKLEVSPPRYPKSREILAYQATPRGIEKLTTRLKRLDYRAFSMVQSGGEIYFKATTKPITAEFPSERRIPHPTNRHRSVKKTFYTRYAIGAYAVYLKFDDLIHGRINNFHFIPEKQKLPLDEDIALARDRGQGFRLVHQRHLHHYAFANTASQISNPLHYEAKTCLGTFGSVFPAVAQEGDLAELFRMIYLFLKIHNPSSPLVGLHQLSHYERISDEN